MEFLFLGISKILFLAKADIFTYIQILQILTTFCFILNINKTFFQNSQSLWWITYRIFDSLRITYIFPYKSKLKKTMALGTTDHQLGNTDIYI